MGDRPAPYLTKSKYVAGLQCRLRLWKEVYTPLPYAEPKPGTPQYVGTRIGELARQCFPDGVLIDNRAFDHKEALERTRRLMASGCPALFEGAFEYANRRIRVDVLKRVGQESWALFEVKSSTSIHDEHYHDAAFQADVLRKAGVTLLSVNIAHVDPKYRRGPVGIDPTRFFKFVDVTDRLQTQSGALDFNLSWMATTLQDGQSPNVPPGFQCHKPYECEFFAQCTKPLPRDWIGYLPRARRAQLDEMIASGIVSIADIPDRFQLRGLQEIVRRVHSTGVPFIAPNIQETLRPLGPPALYLDFESIMPGIPLYPDTSPYQHIPFLFSLHTDIGGPLSHSDFIAALGEDPRREFSEALIRHTAATRCPIIVYSHYEKRVLNELARAFPDLASDLNTIIDRLQDLLAVIRSTIYLPAFNGSFSIKDVGPALSNVKYDDLDIADGSTAAVAYQQLVETTVIPLATKQKSLSDLQAYCKRDTCAMVQVHRALIEWQKRSMTSWS